MIAPIVVLLINAVVIVSVVSFVGCAKQQRVDIPCNVDAGNCGKSIQGGNK